LFSFEAQRQEFAMQLTTPHGNSFFPDGKQKYQATTTPCIAPGGR
jgi:hypothetical protein